MSGMRAFVGLTDDDWYRFLCARPDLDEVNFWQPGGNTRFQALVPGELFLFKLHAPKRSIVGGGFFAHSTILPAGLAWECFEEKNGAESFFEMRTRIAKYRLIEPDTDPNIGCILLEQPFFFSESDPLPPPRDWGRGIQTGKRYDLTSGVGREIWDQLQLRLAAIGASEIPVPSLLGELPGRAYGEPVLHRPRLGQGSFRVVVTDSYERRCAVTGERTLPVLQAAHIKPFNLVKTHDPKNGVLLRSDIHTLFDKGYVTVTPDCHFEVSRRLKEDWENGRDYYALHGREIRVPRVKELRPDAAYLRWHAEDRFLG